MKEMASTLSFACFEVAGRDDCRGNYLLVLLVLKLTIAWSTLRAIRTLSFACFEEVRMPLPSWLFS